MWFCLSLKQIWSDSKPPLWRSTNCSSRLERSSYWLTSSLWWRLWCLIGSTGMTRAAPRSASSTRVWHCGHGIRSATKWTTGSILNGCSFSSSSSFPFSVCTWPSRCWLRHAGEGRWSSSRSGSPSRPVSDCYTIIVFVNFLVLNAFSSVLGSNKWT